jgi:hypothetical protein
MGDEPLRIAGAPGSPYSRTLRYRRWAYALAAGDRRAVGSILAGTGCQRLFA